MKTYTKKQLEGMTSPELVSLYNKNADKPVKRFANKQVAIKRVQEVVAKPTPTPRGESKMAKALEMYQSGMLQGVSRKEMLLQFEQTLGLTKNTASAYYQHCRVRTAA